MAGIHIRNVWATHGGGIYDLPSYVLGIMMKEAFLAGKWTIVETSGDTGWDNNYILSLSDAAVTVAQPLVVTSATGGFTSAHESKIVTLISSNDDVRGMYNVRRVLDSNTIQLDERTRKPTWPADVGGITLRLHDAGNTQPLGNTYFVAQAPATSSCNVQIYVTIDDSNGYIRFKAYPLGDYFGAATVTPESSLEVRYIYTLRLNAYFADPTSDQYYGQIFWWDDRNGYWRILSFGNFSDTLPGDISPGFMQHTDHYQFDYLPLAMQALNESGVQVVHYSAYYKRWETDDDSAKRESQINAIRINGGKQKTFRPIVVAHGGVDGSFIRGTDPRTYCHSAIGSYDGVGPDWWKMGSHSLIPRDGAEDVVPMLSLSY